MKRATIRELLDEDLGTPAEVAQSLRDLEHINLWFGGTATTRQLLRQIVRTSELRSLSLLEVGAGNGYVPLRVSRGLARDGIAVGVTLLDRVASHLPKSGVEVVVGDALELSFGDGSFDVVSCNLLAHHFDSETLERFATEALRVARVAVLINDLIRSPLHLALCYAGLPLFRSRITWHDAPASVRQAYTVDEMRSIMRRVAERRVEISRHYLYRMGVLLWK